MWWVVKAMLRPLYPQERHGTYCIEDWVGPRAVWMSAENLVYAWIRSPDRPARSESLYRLSYPNSRTSSKNLNIVTSNNHNSIHVLALTNNPIINTQKCARFKHRFPRIIH
jgi:hypothetical protein